MEEAVFDGPAIHPVTDPDSGDRASVMATLGPAPVAIDDIVRATGLDIRTVRSVLIELDLAGLTERHGAQLVSLSTRPHS